MEAQIRGFEGVATAVKTSFEALMPPALVDLARPTNDPDWPGLGPIAGLEDPKLYAPSNRFRVAPQSYPAVLIVPQGSPNAVALGDDDTGNEQIGFRYLMRAFILCRALGEDVVALHRNRLMLAGRLVLLRNRQLDEGLWVDPIGTRGVPYRESLSDIEPGGRGDATTYASGFIEFSCTAVESASVRPRGAIPTVDNVHVTLHRTAN